jgi:molybdopterin converting factor subunit 1
VLVQIRIFAMMAQKAGVHQFSLEVPDGALVEQLPALFKGAFPQIPWPAGTMLAVNQEYAPAARALRAGDEVAIIPPVSGG